MNDFDRELSTKIYSQLLTYSLADFELVQIAFQRANVVRNITCKSQKGKIPNSDNFFFKKVSRVDLKIDLPFEEFSVMHEKIKLIADKEQKQQQFYKDKNGLRTFYFGERTSGEFLRLYEKPELGVCRFEVEFKRGYTIKKAHKFFTKFFDANKLNFNVLLELDRFFEKKVVPDETFIKNLTFPNKTAIYSILAFLKQTNLSSVKKFNWVIQMDLFSLVARNKLADSYVKQLANDWNIDLSYYYSLYN